jgi:NhaP-type Na+/H+ or K+/H+ antiporter
MEALEFVCFIDLLIWTFEKKRKSEITTYAVVYVLYIISNNHHVSGNLASPNTPSIHATG